jgi:predicted RNase H-related nuclease YkuK (DUF458 family)
MTIASLDQVKRYIENTSDTTKIYIGSDSARFLKNGIWYAEYATVVVVHYDGCRGCKIFGFLEVEKDFDQKKDKPRMRLMTEVMKTANMYINLEESINERHVEIHLDINPDLKYGSSCVISEAVGYIKGMCNVVPFVKPKAFAASIAADRLLA